MCLFTKESKPSQAIENIKCYKVYLFKHGDCYSPCFETTIPNFGQYINTKLGAALSSEGENIYSVNEGFHSFKFLPDAEKFSTCYNRFPNFLIVECIIPKGSFYYEGFIADSSNYCSDTIILNKVVYSNKDFGSVYYH